MEKILIPPPSSSFTYSSSEDEQTRERGIKVSQLIDKMPANGTYYRAKFDFPNNTFILSIEKNHKQQGNDEFDQFLKQNGVDNRGWLPHLAVSNY